MKKVLIASAGAALLYATVLLPSLTLTTGCNMLSGSSTNSVDTNTINATAIILRAAAQDGAVIAMQDDPTTKQYFELATVAMSTFLTGKDYSPAAFQTALLALNVPALTNAWVQIGLGTVIDLYQLYFGQYAQNAVNGNEIASAFITAIQDGFNAALGNPVSKLKRYDAPLYRKSTRQLSAGNPFPIQSYNILPRPIKK